MSETNGNKGWKEYLHIINPILIFGVGLLVSFIRADINNVKSDLKDYNNKMFLHLTNDEIHTPKALVVTKAEYNIYQQMRDAQMKDLRDGIIDIKDLLKEHMNDK